MDYLLIIIVVLLAFFGFVIWDKRRSERKEKGNPPRELTPTELQKMAELSKRVFDLEGLLVTLYQDLDETEARERGVTVHRLWLEGRNIFINRNS